MGIASKEYREKLANLLPYCHRIPTLLDEHALEPKHQPRALSGAGLVFQESSDAIGLRIDSRSAAAFR